MGDIWLFTRVAKFCLISLNQGQLHGNKNHAVTRAHAQERLFLVECPAVTILKFLIIF